MEFSGFDRATPEGRPSVNKRAPVAGGLVVSTHSLEREDLFSAFSAPLRPQRARPHFFGKANVLFFSI